MYPLGMNKRKNESIHHQSLRHALEVLCEKLHKNEDTFPKEEDQIIEEIEESQELKNLKTPHLKKLKHFKIPHLLVLKTLHSLFARYPYLSVRSVVAM
jgi:hypothetical protein